MGFIIDAVDEFVQAGDVIKLDEIVALNFSLQHMHVRDEKRRKVGKVVDYTIDVDSFMVQQLTVRRPLLRSLNDSELVVHRSQIIEITAEAIVINSEADIPEHTRITTPGSYVNPFRESRPMPDSITVSKR
jgi:sporulation protein YlmC with PRC-barrel domain